jgi:hypothetical protein
MLDAQESHPAVKDPGFRQSSVGGIMADALAFDLIISFCILLTNDARPDLITLTLLRLISSAPLQNSTIDNLISSH